MKTCNITCLHKFTVVLCLFADMGIFYKKIVYVLLVQLSKLKKDENQVKKDTWLTK
jgi:hypothetical protein